MKTLIITVGTRQVGWRCKDNIIRSLGADGTSNHPPHVKELYTQELTIPRGHHDKTAQDETLWGTRHIGELLYQRCLVQQNFSNVVPLLDETIIAAETNQGLDHIVLWGTQQPKSTPWKYRRLDTLWLAQLMKGCLTQRWPHLTIEAWCPILAANDTEHIRTQADAFLTNHLHTRQDNLTLLIQTKGAVPAIANTLDICAAALTRQCTVKQVIPIEPAELFTRVGQSRQANAATTFQTISINTYFWPMERSRILSAWQRGDFTEAKLWLASHKDDYSALYHLADMLAVANNWQLVDALRKIRKHWICSHNLNNIVSTQQQTHWQQQLAQRLPKASTAQSRFLQTWETTWLIELALQRGHTTAAFMQFAQTLERLLYLQHQQLTLASTDAAKHSGFYTLIASWCEANAITSHAPIAKQLHKIREKRNKLVHSGQPVPNRELAQLFSYQPEHTVLQSMMALLHTLCCSSWEIPEQPLLKSLAEWGQSQLKR